MGARGRGGAGHTHTHTHTHRYFTVETHYEHPHPLYKRTLVRMVMIDEWFVCLSHAQQCVDLPQSDVERIAVPTHGIMGEKDPELKYQERMRGVVPNFRCARA